MCSDREEEQPPRRRAQPQRAAREADDIGRRERLASDKFQVHKLQVDVDVFHPPNIQLDVNVDVERLVDQPPRFAHLRVRAVAAPPVQRNVRLAAQLATREAVRRLMS